IRDLAQIINNSRGVSTKPYVLILGAGVSMPAGLPNSTGLIDRVLSGAPEIERDASTANRWERFERRWNTIGHDRQRAYLDTLLTGTRDAKGIGCLADMLADGHFDY